MKTIRLIATALAASAMATSAMAADLGGDCCADLEERVAELEATTARKGNRKVSLTVSGQVNQMVLFWDDGTESNAYVVDNDTSGTRFRFIGKAQITPDWSAGYYLELDALSALSSAVNQNDDEAAGAGIAIRQSNWWLESKQLGRVTVGQGSSSTDDIILADVEGAGPAAYSNIVSIGGGFLLRSPATNLTTAVNLTSFAPSLDTSRRNIVRYDSPTFGGFKVVASYGEDDFWDVALWWSGKVADQLTYAGGIGYLQNSCKNPTGCEAVFGNNDYEEFKGSASFLHNPTGLFLSGAFVHREYDASFIKANGGVNKDLDFWYVRTGIVAKGLLPVGKTVFFGEYGLSEDGIADGVTDIGSLLNIQSSELTNWGLGITQHVDAAAMEIYVMYKNLEAEATGTNGSADFDSLQMVLTGARIKF